MQIRSAIIDPDINLITCATDKGFFMVEPGTQLNKVISKCSVTHAAFPNGVKLIATLSDSNAVTITPYTEVASPCVYIWDRNKDCELTSLKLPDSIYGIRFCPDFIIIATAKQIMIRSISDFSPLSAFDTAFNRHGIFDIPGINAPPLLAYPSPDVGVVTICNCLDTSFRPIHIHVFKSPISFIKFSNNGRLLAVAGDEGKSVTVFSVPSMQQVISIRRTVAESQIVSMSFEPHGTQLAIASDKGIIQVFPLNWLGGDSDVKPPPLRSPIKLKSPDELPIYICFSTKTLKLIGIDTQGKLLEVVFDDQMKASLKIPETLK